MAIIDNINPLVHSSRRGDDFGIASATYHLVTFITDTSTALKSWRIAARTRKELSKLSDRALEDIGLTRGDIVAGTYRGL
jgi:uncharacterized protein YjiS (DUF1127 family)